jgi:hypothetical protein
LVNFLMATKINIDLKRKQVAAQAKRDAGEK